jgi:ligand-binding sensor domain-containing protein
MTITKQLICFFCLLLSVALVSCNEQSNPVNNNTNASSQNVGASGNAENANLNGASTLEIDKNIRSIFQDKSGNYWYGTNADGVYRYDGKQVKHYTQKDGLSNDQVLSIQEDKSGNVWFGTGVFGVSKFDGQTFTTYTDKEHLQLTNGSDKEWKSEQNDLWFCAGDGVYRHNEDALIYLPLSKPSGKSKPSESTPFTLSRYGVYSIVKDRKGDVWFGTQSQGVCRYDGKALTWFTEKGLAGPAVLGLFEDSKGNMWFGNNGSGLFRYDGKTLTNFTKENGLDNADFRATGEGSLGSLARVYSINEDSSGNIWVGTVDAGVWKYDGLNLTHYTTNDGLTSNAVNTIYKDKNGELWFGTDDNGVCKFNGTTFARFGF